MAASTGAHRGDRSAARVAGGARRVPAARAGSIHRGVAAHGARAPVRAAGADRRTAYRWNGPTSKAVTGRSRKDDEPGSGEYRLGVRPVTRTGRGWARGGLTWSNLPHKQRQLELDPAQHRWFCEFGALDRALKRRPAAGSRLGLPRRLRQPRAVDAARPGAALGIRLVGTGARRDMAGRRRWRHIVRDGDGQRWSPRLTVDGAVACDHARPIGDHGIYLADPASPRHIVLAPTAESLVPEQLGP